jgi:hypothetical protein
VTLTIYTPEVHSVKSSLCVCDFVLSIARRSNPLISVTSILYSSVVRIRTVTSWLNGLGYAAISNFSALPSKRTSRISVYSFAPS